jgi:hypothetical protein
MTTVLSRHTVLPAPLHHHRIALSATAIVNLAVATCPEAVALVAVGFLAPPAPNVAPGIVPRACEHFAADATCQRVDLRCGFLRRRGGILAFGIGGHLTALSFAYQRGRGTHTPERMLGHRGARCLIPCMRVPVVVFVFVCYDMLRVFVFVFVCYATDLVLYEYSYAMLRVKT